MPNRSMSAGQAHDRNNLLQVALYLAEALQRRACLDAAGRRLLDDLRRALEGLVAMNRSTLDAFLGSQVSSPAASAAPDGVIESVAILAQAADPRGVRVELRLGAPGVLMPVPEIHLQQVLFNLLKNALEAAPDEGGKVVVESGLQPSGGRDRARGEGRVLRITVTDNGPGLPEELRGRLFACGATAKAGGHGLGLHHARRIAGRYGGTITLCSSHVYGTRATVLWPLG